MNVGRWYPLPEPAEGPRSMEPFSECSLSCMLNVSPGVSVPFNPWTEPLLIPLVVLSAKGMSAKIRGSTVTLGGDL